MHKRLNFPVHIFRDARFFVARLAWALLAGVVIGLAPVGWSGALAAQTGGVTGRPIPRFVSLKTDRVNLREGPSMEHRTAWIFKRAGLPVEITGESDVWRRIRDSDGVEGWVHHVSLSSRRTALIAPWRKGEELPLHAKPQADGQITARLQSGVIAQLKKCDGLWCRLIGEGFDGWMEQSQLWGAYPGEKVE